MTGPRQGAPLDDKRLMLIRASFLTGVLMFGGVTYFLHKQNGAPEGPAPEMLVCVPIAGIAITLLGIFPVRAMWARAADRQQWITFWMIGMALGETAALAGAVYYFLTDDPRFYIAGVFMQLATFMLFPIKRPD